MDILDKTYTDCQRIWEKNTCAYTWVNYLFLLLWLSIWLPGNTGLRLPGTLSTLINYVKYCTVGSLKDCTSTSL